MRVFLKYTIILDLAYGIVSVNNLSELINTLSNQHFAGLDNLNKLENLFSTQRVAKKLNWCC